MVYQLVFKKKKLKRDGYGLNIDETKLNHLRFADALVLVEESPEKLETMLTLSKHKNQEKWVVDKHQTKVVSTGHLS